MLKDINFLFIENGVAIDYCSNNNESAIDFYRDKIKFIYELAFQKIDYELSQSALFLYNVSKTFMKELLNIPGLELLRDGVELNPSEECIEDLLDKKPYCIGTEFINKQWIQFIFQQLLNVFRREIKEFHGSVDLYFTQKDKKLKVPSRLFFHLVENPEGDNPFAFMITYTTKVNDKVKHLPLKHALAEFKNDKQKLKELISPINSIAAKSKFLKSLVENGELFSPVSISTTEAYDFLKETDLYENNGVICRIPNWWNNKTSKTKITVDLEQKIRDGLGFLQEGNLVFFSPKMEYDGVEITKEEISELLSKTEGLSVIKGKWVEIDKEKLTDLMNQYDKLKNDGTTISEVLRLTAKISDNNSNININCSNEDWLKEFIIKQEKNNPIFLNVPDEFIGKLRPYQFDGYKWLLGMSQLKFGICLADDMGLGKTIEILSFLMAYYRINPNKKVLLIVPASLIGNWENEIKKFTPSLQYYVANRINSNSLMIMNSSLTITTYQVAIKLESLYQNNWGLVILDEAQAIKNSDTITARKIKTLQRDSSIALTGTPIENNLLDLWSLFDFLNPGLLGNQSEFRSRINIKSNTEDNTNRLKYVINPFILRRLKTDKNIIPDLPEKNENDIYIDLTKEQIILYNNEVKKLENNIGLEDSKFMQKSKILTTILKLKQICNHPSQFLGDEDYSDQLSGKFMVLKEICQTIFEKREKVIIFTQFKEIIPALDNLVSGVFNRQGYVITGETTMNNRNKYIQDFQTTDMPYMILTLKTAGVGINLTSAQNVIHFDRWWNPAVENQATDRAFRIGQTKTVNVYKFVSKNTIEEIINKMLITKKDISDSILDNVDENILTKLSSEELLKSMKFMGGE